MKLILLLNAYPIMKLLTPKSSTGSGAAPKTSIVRIFGVEFPVLLELHSRTRLISLLDVYPNVEMLTLKSSTEVIYRCSKATSATIKPVSIVLRSLLSWYTLTPFQG